jgi:hypothetical protein
MHFLEVRSRRTWHIFGDVEGDVEGDVAGNQIGFGGI